MGGHGHPKDHSGEPKGLQKKQDIGLPGAPVVRTQCCLCRGQFPSLTGKLISHTAQGQKKKHDIVRFKFN